MKKFWQSNSFKVFIIFFGWLIFVGSAVVFSINKFTFTPTFPYYGSDLGAHYNRFFSTFAHFDGIHYLRIAKAGIYPDGGELAFFPAYPFLVHGLQNIGLNGLASGLIISAFALIISLFIFLHLYPSSSWKLTILLLSYPMSFYLISVYTESLFLLSFALMLYCINQKKYFLAALAVALATATRFVGIAMVVYLVAAMWGSVNLKKIVLAIMISLSGLCAYMFYLWQTVGDALAFIHVQPSFGMGRSGGEIVLLPQVIYRYIKMLLYADPSTLLYYRAFAEVALFAVVVAILIKYYRRLSRPELVYTLVVLLLPTVSGTLSSYPRYAMVAIPLFAVLASKLSNKSIIVVATIQAIFLFISIALFTTGLFVA